MEKYKYLILGAGPAGLTAANRLKQLGEESFLVLELEKEAGGLCRSAMVDGSPLDIGGGHFLDVRRPKVNDFLFEFMPEEEWDIYERDSRIAINGEEVSHPLEANIWQMSIEEQIKYLSSIAQAGCNSGVPMPESFVSWIYWKLGKEIADNYMIPYNQKMFGEELNELGTYWLDKLPNVSFEDTLRSCLMHKPYGTQPGHASFYYPKKYGYGELWLRMAKAIGEHLEYSKAVTKIDFENKIVKTKDGAEYRADIIITTIPWESIECFENMPEELQNGIKELRHTGVEIRYHENTLETEAQWIYYPDKELNYHRILVRSNFCPNAKGYWTETNLQRVDSSVNSGDERYSFCNAYAYPLNTKNKPQIMKNLLEWTAQKSVFGLGRWGEHQHYNSDRTVERAMELVESLN